MDTMTSMGGRKFLMSLVVLGVAIFLETHSDKGLSTTMAGFMVAIVGTFHVSNYACSTAFAKSKAAGGGDVGPLHKKLDDLSTKVSDGFSPERTEQLKQLFIEMKSGIQQNQVLTGQVAQTLLNLGQQKR